MLNPDISARIWHHLRNRDQRPRPPRQRNRLQVIRNEEDGTAEIRLYDEIGFFGTTASDFCAELAGIDAGTISLRVNSPGGDVFDGVAIYNALVDHPATVNVTVDALAASAASFISMAGDSITMNRASQMMIHDAMGLCIGNAAAMAEMQELLDRISDEIAGIYASRAGESVDFWRERMRAESWYTASEAVDAGLADQAGGTKAQEPDEDEDEDEETPDEGEGEPEPDEEEEEEAVAARWDLATTGFLYAGRMAAPAPVLAAAPAFNAAAFRAAMRKGVLGVR